MAGSMALLLRLNKVGHHLEGQVVGLMDFILMRGKSARPTEAGPAS